MRTARQIPWYLIASILISLSALALANLPAPPLKEAGSYLALALVILIPGYLAVLSLFPSASDLDLIRRLLLSLVASLLLAGLISLILYMTPRGLEPASLATILSFFTLFLAALSYLRWSALPRSRRFIIGAKRGYSSRRTSGRILSGPFSRWAPLLVALAAVLILAGLAMAFYHYQPGMNFFSTPEGYTDIEVTWPESEPFGSSDQQYTTLTAGRDLEARARIDNHEGKAVNYSLRLVYDNSTIFVKGLRLENNETWESMLGFVLVGPPGRQRLDLHLFKEEDSTTPYKSEHLMVDLIDDQSEDQSEYQDLMENSSNESKGNSSSLPVSFEETTKVTVLSAGGGGGSAASSPTPARSPKSAAKETEKEIEKENTENPSPATDTVQAGEATAASSEINAQPMPTIISGEISSEEDESLPDSTSAMQAASESSVPPQSASGPEDESNDQPAKDDPIPSQLAEEDAVVNKLPVLLSLQPDRPSPQTKGTAIIWRAEATDPDDDQILYRFLVNGEEKRKWSKSSSWSWPTHYLPAGEYTITVQAIDGLHSPPDSFDSSLDAKMVIKEQNQMPLLKELKADPESPNILGAEITWTAVAFDPDGDEPSYRFLLDGREVSGWSSSDSWIWKSAGAEPGDHKITVQTRDGLHAKQASFDDEIDTLYTLTESKEESPPESRIISDSSVKSSFNQIPVLLELKPDAISPIKAGAIISWIAIATDPDPDDLSYKFLLDGQDMTGWSSSASWSWNTNGALPGAHNITVLARDGLHASADSFDSSLDTEFFLESENLPPVLLSLEPDLSSPQIQGSTILWRAEAADPDEDPILYKFQVGGKDMGRWSESGNWSWSTQGLAAGDYRITVLARDGHHSSEYSFDSSLVKSFSLNTAIDQQIDQLMSQRGFKASGDSGYRSKDIRLDVADP